MKREIRLVAEARDGLEYVRRRNSGYWKDIGWTSVGAAAGIVVSIGMMPVLTRLYAPAEVAGHYLFIQLAGALVVIQTGRLEHLVQIPETHKEAFVLVNLCLVLGLLFGAAALPLFWLFNGKLDGWFDISVLGQLVWLLPLYSLLLGISVALESLMQRQGEYRRAGAGEVANRLTYAGIAVGAGTYIARTQTLVMASIVSLFLKSSYLAYNLRQVSTWESASVSTLVQCARNHGARAANLVVAHLMQLVSLLLPMLFIAQAYGAEKLGYFSLVATTLSVPTGLLGTSIGKVYYQRAAGMASRGEDVTGLWVYTLNRLILIAVPVFGVVAFSASWLYPYVFGQKWLEAGEVATLMCPSFFAGFISVPLDRNAVLADKRWYILCWNCARLVFALVTIFLARTHGWGFSVYVICVSAAGTVLYLADLLASRSFLSSLGKKGSPVS